MNISGLSPQMGNLYLLSSAKSRSISPENRTGEKGRGGMCALEEGSARHAARDLGDGWKVNPYLVIQPGDTACIAEIEGPGSIQHIWLTPTGKWRNTILRIYWDGQEQPSVQCPIGDFFASCWQQYARISSLAVCVNPGSAFNCYWPMPFRKNCRMTLENRSEEAVTMYYQIDYALAEVPPEAAYFHAQFRRINPLPYREVYPVLDRVQGRGQYVGTFLAWQSNNTGWWGEGEMKFYLDGDRQYPTICGTGTEDYFCGSYNFENPMQHRYESFSSPYTGFHAYARPDGLYQSQQRFGMYRWHIADPIRFEEDIRVTIQALGWREGGRYLPLQDDIASVAFWYQTLPTAPFPSLPDKDALEII